MAKYRGFVGAPTLNSVALGDVQSIDVNLQSDLRQRGGDDKLYLDSQGDFNRRGAFSIESLNASSAVFPGTAGALLYVLKGDGGVNKTNTISNCLVNNRRDRAPFSDYAAVSISGGFVSSDGSTNPWAIT
jgi:hypothetical protein